MHKYFASLMAEDPFPVEKLHISPAAAHPLQPTLPPVASSTHGDFDNDPGTQRAVVDFVKSR
jgi:hypothetical protein